MTRTHRHKIGAVQFGRWQGRYGKRRFANGEAPGKPMLMGADPRLPQDAGKAHANGLLVAVLPHRTSPAGATHALKAGNESHPGLPVARRRCRKFHPLRPRLLGRANDRAFMSMRKSVGRARAPGAAVFPDDLSAMNIQNST